MGGGFGQRHATADLPPGKTRYPLYRRLGGPQGRTGQVGKISPPPGFDPRTVQPVASRYTHWATPAQSRFHNTEPEYCLVSNTGYSSQNKTKTTQQISALYYAHCGTYGSLIYTTNVWWRQFSSTGNRRLQNAFHFRPRLLSMYAFQ